MIQILTKKLQEVLKDTIYEHNTFFVGGCVRDYLLNVKCKDYDLCVELENGGIELSHFLINNYPDTFKHLCIFPTYGTTKLTMIMDDIQLDIEIVETRKEQYKYENSRNPECCFGTITEDSYRRDLTINSLYMSIYDGEIYDYCGLGISDLENKIIRTPCDANITYTQDPLRMMRTIRFSSRYGWDIDKDTLSAICLNSHRLSIISKERIQDEFSKILVGNNVVNALNILKETKLMEYIIPELPKTYNLTQNKYHIGTVWEHTLSVVEKTQPILLNRLCALLHDIGKIDSYSEDENGNVHFYKHDLLGAELSSNILKTLKFNNDIINRVFAIISNHMRLKSFNDECNMKDKHIRKLIYDMGDDLETLLDIVDSDNKSHSVEYCLPNQIRLLRERILHLNDKVDNMVVNLPINGTDVIYTLKIEPSRLVRDVLDYVRDKYFENPNITKQECIELIKYYNTTYVKRNI